VATAGERPERILARFGDLWYVLAEGTYGAGGADAGLYAPSRMGN
jgi:hypothetical protein